MSSQETVSSKEENPYIQVPNSRYRPLLIRSSHLQLLLALSFDFIDLNIALWGEIQQELEEEEKKNKKKKKNRGGQLTCLEHLQCHLQIGEDCLAPCPF